MKKTYQVGIDRTVYGLLRKQRKEKLNLNKKEDSKNKKEEEGKVRWRGPREQPSEIPMKRNIFSKNNLVHI